MRVYVVRGRGAEPEGVGVGESGVGVLSVMASFQQQADFCAQNDAAYILVS
jgi:hypothetical protein